MLETPSMKHEGLQYFQCLLVKEQATIKKTFLDMREVQTYEWWQDTWLDFLFGWDLFHSTWHMVHTFVLSYFAVPFFIIPPNNIVVLLTYIPLHIYRPHWDPTNTRRGGMAMAARRHPRVFLKMSTAAATTEINPRG
jgi:hypothetical protein